MAGISRATLWRWSLVGLVLAVLATLGHAAAEWRAGSADARMRERLLQQAIEIAQAIDPEVVRELTFSPADPGAPAYERLRQQLIAYGQVFPQRGIYTLALRDGRLLFGPENYAEDDPMASPPGTVYLEPGPEDFAIFETGRPYIIGPVEDEYRVYVSALAPVRDPNSGQVLLAVGLDIAADAWQARLSATRRAPWAVALALMALVLGFALALQWRERLPAPERARLKHVETWLVGSLGLCLTLSLAALLAEAEVRERQLLFDRLAEARAASVRAAFRDIKRDLAAIARFYEGSEYVDADEFAAFTGPLASSVAVWAYAWAPAVTAEQKPAFEALARAEGLAGLAIWEQGADGAPKPAAPREIYYPIRYVQPPEGNEGMLGFDLASDAARRQALENAWRTGLPTASDTLTLMTGPRDQAGVLVAQPAYAQGGEGAEPPLGFALGAIRLQAVLESALWRYADEPPLIAIGLADIQAATGPTTLATYPPSHLQEHAAFLRLSDLAADSLRQVHPLFAFGRAWAISSHPLPAFDALNAVRAGWLAGLIGLCLTAALTLLVGFLRDRQESLAQEVERRLAQLRASEEQLRQSQAKLLSIYSAAPVGVGLVLDRVILEANDALCQMTGYTRAELIGQDARLLYASDEDYAFVGQEKYRQIREMGMGTVETRWRRKSGEMMDILLSSVLLNPADPAAGVTFTALDISERKRAEEAVRAERDRAQRYLDVAGVILLHLDPGGNTTLINQKGLQVLGCSEAEVLGASWVDRFVPPEAREETRQVLQQLVRGVVMPDLEYHENEVLTAQGERRLVAWHNTVVYDAAGRCLGLLCSGEDITERRRAEEALRVSEERYQRISEMISDYAYAFEVAADGALRLDWIVGGFERITGYTPEELQARGGWAALIYPEDMPIAQERARRLFSGQQDTSEFRIVRKDGQVRWLRDHGYPVWEAAHRRVVRIYGAAEDITERRRAEAERLEMERRLLQAQKLESLGVLAGGIAHDFNNLLMAILGNLELAQGDLSPLSPARETISEAANAARRAADLTRQLLAYAGKGRFAVQRVDLSALVQENAHLLRAAISKTTTFSLRLAESLPPIEADPGQIQQVIMNLITNAAEAIGEQPGVITLTTGVEAFGADDLRQNRLAEPAQPGRFVFLEVADTGCGMDEATQQRIFEPFFTTKFTGRGLGMSAVEGVVRAHRGAILVESAPGRGTTIRVLFPLTAEADASAAATDAQRAGGQRADLQGTALVVDDEEAVRRVCSAMLRRLGLAVLEAADGQEAVDLFGRHADEIDVIILDLSMPHMDGLTALQALRRIRPEVEVLLSSGYSEQEATQHLTEGGAAGFIQKPYQLQSLRDKVARALGKGQ